MMRSRWRALPSLRRCLLFSASAVLTLRAGKLERLHTWLQAQRSALCDCPIAVYSDSINPLPLPAAAPQAVAVDPDERLAAEAAKRGWPVISLR